MTIPSLPIERFTPSQIEPGHQERLWLELFPSLLAPVAIPAIIARGQEPGPTLLAVAGVHGDEYEGMEAIRQVFDTLDPTEMRGTFIGIPVANPLAYEARTRIAPLHLDGLNLARVFPGDPAGSPSRLVAHHLLEFVLRHVGPDGLFIDFHSGSADVQYATLIGWRDVPGPARDRAEAAGRYFGVDRLWRIPMSPGPFNAETARRGVPTIGTETTGRAGCDPADVATFVRGLNNLLVYLGLLPDIPRPPYQTGPARTTIEVLAPAAGFMRAWRRLHEHVAHGDLLADIVSVFGEPLAELRAPVAGTIWAARAMPAVRVGELTYMIALDAG